MERQVSMSFAGKSTVGVSVSAGSTDDDQVVVYCAACAEREFGEDEAG